MNFKNKILLAPLAAVTDIAFRKLCTDYGADIVYSQMIDQEALTRGNTRLVDFYDEKNVGAQFIGNDPKKLVKCIELVEKKVKTIDLNLGCPHSNVVKRICASYLLKYPKRIKSILEAMVPSTKLPVTIKIRAGYDKEHINAIKIAKMAEKTGIAALTIHGRPRTVNYQTPVNYDIIKKVKQAISISVAGNGDILDPISAKKMFDYTGVDSIMVARGAIGNPAIFNEIKHYLKTGKIKKPINKQIIFKKYLKYAKKYKIDFARIKAHVQWMTKGMEGGSKIRVVINNAKSLGEIKDLFT